MKEKWETLEKSSATLVLAPLQNLTYINTVDKCTPFEAPLFCFSLLGKLGLQINVEGANNSI